MTYLVCFFGGALLVNALPHLINGISGRAFPTPFARPRGRGESSALLNVIWGAASFALGYILLFPVANFDPRAPGQAVAAGLGALLLALGAAWHFGSVYGGDRPTSRD